MPRYVRVASVHDIPSGSRRRFSVDEHDLVVIHQGQDWFAVHYRCPHTGGPLGDGLVLGGKITCPQHRWRFDLRTGQTQRRRDPCARIYPVRIEGDDLYVGL